VVEKHVWARRDGELVTVGMTMSRSIWPGTIVAVTPKATERLFRRGRT